MGAQLSQGEEDEGELEEGRRDGRRYWSLKKEAEMKEDGVECRRKREGEVDDRDMEEERFKW